MSNFCSLAFDSRMGAAVYSPSCELLISGTMHLLRADEFVIPLTDMRDHWNITVAIIQAFGDIPAVNQNLLDAAREVFPDHILVNRDQWNPVRMSFDNRRALAEATLARKIRWPEQIDAILMGKWLCDILHASGVPFPAAYFDDLARTTRRFPRRQDLRCLQGRILAEAAAL